MAGTLGTIVFFVALIVVIVIHEAAHFGMAKRFGIKVEQFFVGFGPKIWSTIRGETEYGVKWILAGGYVRIAGMNPYEEVASDDLPRTFGAKPIWQRSLVIVAGPATHFVLAFLCFAIWLAVVGQFTARSPVIVDVAPTLGSTASPASAAGFEPGDRIIAVGDIQDPTSEQTVRYVGAHVGEPIQVRVERGDVQRTLTVVPVRFEGKGRMGVVLTPARETVSPLSAVVGGAELVWDSLVATVANLGRVFGPEGIGRVVRLITTDAPRRPTDPQSLVGVGAVTSQTASGGNAGDLLYLFAYINVFIGFLNLLPLPPFDGGHLALLAIEKVRGGRQIDPRKIVPVSIAVIAFFVLFTLSVVYLDITKPLQLAP